MANHSLRLNLDNEQHRRVERVLADLNLDVHKSIKQFLVEAVDCYIRKLEGTELTYGDVPKKQDSHYITRDELEQMRIKIKDELQKEMIGVLASSLITGKVVHMPEVRPVRKAEVQSEEETADETTIGLASSWG